MRMRIRLWRFRLKKWLRMRIRLGRAFARKSGCGYASALGAFSPEKADADVHSLVARFVLKNVDADALALGDVFCIHLLHCSARRRRSILKHQSASLRLSLTCFTCLVFLCCFYLFLKVFVCLGMLGIIAVCLLSVAQRRLSV